jgi:hypothetical protein
MVASMAVGLVVAKMAQGHKHLCMHADCSGHNTQPSPAVRYHLQAAGQRDNSNGLHEALDSVAFSSTLWFGFKCLLMPCVVPPVD